MSSNLFWSWNSSLDRLLDLVCDRTISFFHSEWPLLSVWHTNSKQTVLSSITQGFISMLTKHSLRKARVMSPVRRRTNSRPRNAAAALREPFFPSPAPDSRRQHLSCVCSWVWARIQSSQPFPQLHHHSTLFDRLLWHFGHFTYCTDHQY